MSVRHVPGLAIGIVGSAAAVLACAAGSSGNGARSRWESTDTSKAVNLDRFAGLDGSIGTCTPDAKDDHGACRIDCDVGLASACAILASRGEHEGHPSTALHYHEKACELRDPAGCVAAARMHANGLGAPRNRAKQVELLTVACNLGEATACSIAAKAFVSGSGVERDPSRASSLWERACTSGDRIACDKVADAGR
jgi:TPR repeat protein